MIRIKKVISLFAAVAMLCSMFVGTPVYVSAVGEPLELVVDPGFLLPEKINSTTESDRTITVDVNTGITRPWNNGDAISVEVLRNADTYLITPTSVSQTGGAITVVLPQTDIINIIGADKRGGYSVNVKLADVILGTGYLEINNVAINNIEIREGEDRIHLNGTGLITIKSPTLYAEVYQGANKISTSKQTSFIWGNLEFEFGSKFALSTSYTLKLFDGASDISSKLPNLGVFTVTPILVCSYNSGSPIIAGNADATLVISDRNNLWAVDAPLKVQINGPNGGYEITGLTASEDNVQFTLNLTVDTAWPEGTYDVRIMDDTTGTLKGVSQFYVGTSSNILQGEVKDSYGNLVASCGNVNIEKIEEGGYTSWQRQVFVLPDGKFYLPNNELGDGNYKASIAAPNTLHEADAQTKFSVAGGAITPNPIVLQFQLPNISGTVKLPDGSNCNVSVPISVSDNSEMKNQISKTWTKTDGTFFIKLSTSGTYNLKAWPDQLQAIPTETEIAYDGTPQSNIVLQFKLPQIAVTAKDPDGGALTTNNFRIEIEPVDYKNRMYDISMYQNQYLAGNMAIGKYNVYAVPDGDCMYTRSFPQTVDITETNPASPITLDISLTNPKLTGTVTGMTGQDGYVALYKKIYNRFERVGSFNVDNVGNYKIGGVDNGDYYLRAELHSDSSLRGSNGPSVMTPVTITDTSFTKNLALGNTAPRILYVRDMQNGEDKASVRVVNINGITRNPTENDSLRAEIVKLDGSSFSPKVEISGANNFMIRWDYMDKNNNETDIEINMPKDINIPAGTYKLNLYDIKDSADTGDDVLIASDLTDGNKFEMLTAIEASKYGFFPSKTGQHTIVKAYGEIQPWASGDTLTVTFISSNGLETAAAAAIQTDNTLDITVPSLTEGKYDMLIKKGDKLLARQYIEVGTPVVSFINSPSDTDANLTLDGQYMSVLIGSGAIIKIYSGDTLVRTVQKMWNMWGSLEAEYYEPLPVGDYTVKVWAGAEVDANLLTLPNAGALKVIKNLKSSKPCVLTGYANGTTQTLSAYNGSVPWQDNDDLALKLVNEWGKGDAGVDIPLSDDNAVSATDLTFQLPDDSKLANGKWRVEVYSDTNLIARGNFDVIDSSEVAFSGTITGAEGGAASGARIIMESLDQKNFYQFYADANGSYKAYRIDNPGTYNVWIEPKETDPYMKLPQPRVLTIDDTGHCATPTQNFVLPVARIISGTVNLPSGATATSDMEFWVNGFSENGTPTNKSDDKFGESGGKIAIGSSSSSYILKVPKVAASGYYVQMGIKTDDYIGNYYYASGAVKYSLNDATIVDVSSGDQSGKNFTLEVGRKIQGNITIPDTISISPEGYNLEVFALMDNGTFDVEKDDWYIGNKVTLSSSTQAYTLQVPANLSEKKYKVGYHADPYGMLELGGYYASTGTVYDDGTTAGPVDLSSADASSINLTARIRTDTEKRAGFIAALVNKIGAEKFVQPTVDEISAYSTTYNDWSLISDTQKPAMAIAVRNGIVNGTTDGKICPNEFVNRAEGMVILARATYALGARLVETQPNIYFDDIKGHWAEGAIHNMARAGVISGYEDGRFYPELYLLSRYTDALLTGYVAKLATANATRAGVIASVINGLGKTRFTLPTDTEIAEYAAQYTDWCKVPDSMTYAMAIAVKNGIISGNNEGLLLPNEKISRAEAAVLLCDILKNATPVLTLKQIRIAPSFFDIPAEHPAKTSIDSLYRANVINGITTSTFAPDQAVTNDSIGYLVQNLFGGIYVAPAVISLQPESQTVTYGVASVTLSVTATGENISYQWKKDGAAISGATASTYTINNPDPTHSGAYTVEMKTGTAPLFATVASTAAMLTVNPKQLTVTGLTAGDKTYDGTTAAVISGTSALDGIVGSDDVALTGTPTAVFENKNAADAKKVNVTGYTITGNDISKYILVQPVLSANISKADLTATADNKQRAFGAANPTFTITYNGFISGESVANSGITQPGITCTATVLSPGGAYPITLTGGSGGANYTLSLVNGTLAVIPDFPNVTFSLDGADANKLKGSTAAMEYSLDGGTTWTACTVDTDLTAQLSNISAQYDIKVREKAVTGPPAVPAGVVLTIDILAAPVAPSLTVNFASEKIMNATNIMEYKIDSGAYQTVLSTEAVGGIDLSSIIPANGSIAKVLTIRVKSTGHTLSGVEQTINIPVRPATPLAPTLATAGLTPTSITLMASAGLEYTKTDGAAWQSGNIFTGLGTGTTYLFKQRVKATTSAFASDKSPVLPVKYHTVAFEPNNGSAAIDVRTAVYGETIAAPADMIKIGYTGGTASDWYASEDLSGPAYSFTTPITANITLYAKWTINKYNVTATVTGGGVISPAGQKVAYGDNLTLTILPDTGYELTVFTVGETDKKSSIVSGKYLISNITADTAVNATFSKKSYVVTKNAGIGGSITANATAEYGSSLVATIVPVLGKNIGSVEYIMNGTTVRPTLNGSNQFTIASVTGPVTINATFADVDKSALKTAIINALPINPDAYIDSVKTTFKTALASAILVLADTSATAEEVLAAKTALTGATANLTDANKKKFSVTVSVPDSQGNATVDKPSPMYGENVTINATPADGYVLYKILVNGAQLNGNIINNVTSNAVVTVLFKSTIPQAVIDFKANHAIALGRNITNVINDDSSLIDAALTAYGDPNILTADQQKYLAVEYQLLKTLRTYLDNKTKAQEVIDAITALSDDTRNLTFVGAVNSVIAKYFSLTPDQQKLVGIVNIYTLNKYKLEADVIFQKDLVDTARINHVNGLVEALKTTIGEYSDIAAATMAYNAAKTAYESLSTDLKSQITTTKLTALKTAIDSANQAAALTVETQINALTVVLSTMAFDAAEGYKKAIIEAKNAYDALTEAQKAFVSLAAKAKLTECFESVAVIIEKPVEGLDTSVSFTGISDKVSDMTVAPADASKEAAVNQKLNTDGADTARKTDMVISITLKDSSDQTVQPDGKVVMKIKISADIKNRKPKIMSLDGSNNLFEVPSWITGSDASGWYLQFETDHFSDYAVVSAVQNNNANLLELTLDGITLSPIFNKDTTSYTASIANTLTSTVVNPVVEDTGKATATGAGTWSLSVGSNTKNIVVTAEDGTTKTYTVTVTRAADTTSNGDSSGSTSSNTTTPNTAADTNNHNKTEEPVISKDGNTTIVLINTQLNNTTGEASADIGVKTVESLVAMAKVTEGEGKKAVVEFKIQSSDVAKLVSVDIPREAFNRIVTETKADVKVDAGLGTITFNSNAVKRLSQSNEGDISISVSKVEKSSLSPEVQSKVGERPVYNFSVKAGNTEITKFGDGAAMISIPYTLEAGEKKNAVIVYYIDSKGKLITVRGSYDEATKTVNFKTNHFSCYAVGYNEVKFNDVSASAWYNEAVGFIAARGITTGTGSGNYEPDLGLTRGQYIVMIMRAYGIEPLENSADNFADGGNAYYTSYLAAAKKLGITKGIGNNMYAPSKNITRQEVFALLYNTLKAIGELPEGSSGKDLKSFSDYDKIAPWAMDAMTLFVQTGIVSGSNDKLTPEDTSNRAQMAQVIYNLMAK